MSIRLKPAVFLHMQKTAGTSIQKLARQVYGSKNVLSHADYIDKGLFGCELFPFVSGHFGYDFAVALMPGRFSFTFLRDPAERLLSFYRFCRSGNPAETLSNRIAQEGDLLHFLDPCHGDNHWSHIWNHQTLQLAHGYGSSLAGRADYWGWEHSEDELLSLAASHLSTLDYVGLHETFARDVKEIFRQLGSHGRLAIPMVNASSGTALAQLSEAEMKRVRELTKLDARLYSITLDKRREQQAYERNWKWPWPRLRTLP